MKDKKKKIGFTLIELLAVIIVLAIIALIATPIIFNVIENAKLKSLENGCYGVIDAVRTKYAEGLLNSEDGTVKLSGDVKDITVSGEQPIEGTWEIDNSSDSDNRGIKIKDVKFGSMKDYTCTNVNSDGTINSKVTCTKNSNGESEIKTLKKIYSYDKVNDITFLQDEKLYYKRFNEELSYHTIDEFLEDITYNDDGTMPLVSLNNYNIVAVDINVLTGGSLSGYTIVITTSNYSEGEIIYVTNPVDFSSMISWAKADKAGWLVTEKKYTQDYTVSSSTLYGSFFKNYIMRSSNPKTPLSSLFGNHYYFNPYTNKVCESTDSNCYGVNVISENDTTVNAIFDRNLVEDVSASSFNSNFQSISSSTNVPTRLLTKEEIIFSSKRTLDYEIEENISNYVLENYFFFNVEINNLDKIIYLDNLNGIKTQFLMNSLSNKDTGDDEHDNCYYIENGDAVCSDFGNNICDFEKIPSSYYTVGIRPVVTINKSVLGIN